MAYRVNGKLLVYVSSFTFRELRFKSLSLTVMRIAKFLGLDFEILTFKGRFKPIYVYYENGDGDSVPLYCDKGEEVKSEVDICSSLRSMMFTLSFHPQYSDLTRVRDRIMKVS